MTKIVATAEEEKLIDFKVINEEWNQFELEDGTIIRTKFVLVNIISKGQVRKGVYRGVFTLENVSGVFSPIGLRGPPGRKYSVDELKKHITQRNLKFKQTLDGGWNEYETEKAIFQVQTILRSVDKTSLFDSAGMPGYVLNFEHIITSKPKTKSIKVGSKTSKKPFRK